MKKTVILIVLLAVLIGGVFAQDTSEPTVLPNDEITEQTVSPKEDVTQNIQETNEIQETTEIFPESSVPAMASWIWPLVFLVLGILVILPWFLDTVWNIMVRKRLLDELRTLKIQYEEEAIETNPGGDSEKTNKNATPLKKPKNMDLRFAYYDRVLSSFAERKGMSRFSLMMAVTLIIGAVMLYLAIYDTKSELLKSSLAVLTGALASIIGFYFGGRTGDSGGDKPKNDGTEKSDGKDVSTATSPQSNNQPATAVSNPAGENK